MGWPYSFTNISITIVWVPSRVMSWWIEIPTICYTGQDCDFKSFLTSMKNDYLWRNAIHICFRFSYECIVVLCFWIFVGYENLDNKKLEKTCYLLFYTLPYFITAELTLFWDEYNHLAWLHMPPIKHLLDIAVERTMKTHNKFIIPYALLSSRNAKLFFEMPITQVVA